MMSASYSVIRYIPDPGRGESLNVGILLWDTEAFQLRVDAKAIERVVRENPLLERDALLYVEPLLRERLSTQVGASVVDRIESFLTSQRGFPIELSEPRSTSVEPGTGLDVALERLARRIVRPKRRAGGRGTNPLQTLERRLRPLLEAGAVHRNYFFESKTRVPRQADFYANSGGNVALDVLRLALAQGDAIRLRSDAEAMKVYDVLGANNPPNDYVVLCEFGNDPVLGETNENARTVIEAQGAKIVTDLDEATTLLKSAASKAS